MKRILLLAAVGIIAGVTSGCCCPNGPGPGLFGGPGILPRNSCVTRPAYAAPGYAAPGYAAPGYAAPTYDALYGAPVVPTESAPVIVPEVIPAPS